MTRFLHACRLANGVKQDDLYGSDVRPQFCTMCAAVADAVYAVISTAPPSNQKQFAVRLVCAYSQLCSAHTPCLQRIYNFNVLIQDAVQGVKHAAASAGTSGQGKLDKALKRLLLSLDAASSNDRSAFDMRILYVSLCIPQRPACCTSCVIDLVWTTL